MNNDMNRVGDSITVCGLLLTSRHLCLVPIRILSLISCRWLKEIP
jgi:hypothetical protein